MTSEETTALRVALGLGIPLTAILAGCGAVYWLRRKRKSFHTRAGIKHSLGPGESSSCELTTAQKAGYQWNGSPVELEHMKGEFRSPIELEGSAGTLLHH